MSWPEGFTFSNAMIEEGSIFLFDAALAPGLT
jgi:hypothetical protein